MVHLIGQAPLLGGGPDTLVARMGFTFTRYSQETGAMIEAAVDAADLVLLVTTTGPIDLERMLETIRQINKPSSVLLTQTRYGTRSLRHAEEFLAENGLAHCRETIPYKEAMRLAPDEGRFPSASGYGLIAKELSDAFNA